MIFPKYLDEGSAIDDKGGIIGGIIGGTIGGIIGGIIEGLTDRQREVLEVVLEDPTISISAISKRLNINRSAVQAHFDALKEKGIITRVGGTRGYWKINYMNRK